MLSIPYEGALPPLNMSPDRQKERMLEVLLDWLRLRASGRPVLFIVEDLHWVDPTTQELLGRFVEQGGEDGILAMFTFRPEYEPPWKGRAHQTQIALTRLTRRQVSEMMRAQTGAAEVSDVVIDQIVERTDGVPLFVEEFTRMLAEGGTDWAGPTPTTRRRSAPWPSPRRCRTCSWRGSTAWRASRRWSNWAPSSAGRSATR